MSDDLMCDNCGGWVREGLSGVGDMNEDENGSERRLCCCDIPRVKGHEAYEASHGLCRVMTDAMALLSSGERSQDERFNAAVDFLRGWVCEDEGSNPDADVEATPEMIEAGVAALFAHDEMFHSADERVAAVFRAMRRAAMKPD